MSDWLNREPDPPDHHVSHMRRVALVWGVIMFFIFLVNLQVLRETVLVNSPSYDALVYQNWSYSDYYLLRQSAIRQLINAHIDESVPPLYILSGTFFYTLLGPDPANFYIAPALWFFMLGLGVYGFVHYWTRQRILALFGMILVMSLPSVISFGLRVSQIDFSVGAAFTWCTYVLTASDGLRSRKGSIIYGISTSLCILLKASIVPYFAVHGIIWAIYLLREKVTRRVRLINTLLVVLIVAVLAGWYYVLSLHAILAYYLTWGSAAGAARSGTVTKTLWDQVSFYGNAFGVFHIRYPQIINLYLGTVGVVLALALASLITHAIAERHQRASPNAPVNEASSSPPPNTLLGVAFSFIWLVVPYTILSFYGSKAYSVDFPFVATYLIIPVLILAVIFKKRWSIVGAVVLLPLVWSLGKNQIENLFYSELTPDWKEAEILGDIFYDADARSLGDITVGSAFIHPFLTSENLRYYVLDGKFTQYRLRFHEVNEGYYNDPQSFFAIFQNANYVLAKTGDFIPNTHPNNVLAPQVNNLLASSPDFVELKRYHLPDGSDLIVYFNVNRASISYDPPVVDQWIGPRFPVHLRTGKKDVVIEIRGSIPLPSQLQYPVSIMLQDESGNNVARPRKVPNNEPFAVRFTLPIAHLSPDSQYTFYIVTDKPYQPSALGINADTRTLMLRLTSISIVEP